MIATAPQAKPRLDLRPPRDEIQWVAVAPVASASPWLLDALRSLTRLELLEEDWDGYGSRPVTVEAMDSARSLLRYLSNIDAPSPQISPVTGGGLNVIWQLGAKGIEIEVLPAGDVEYLISEDSAGHAEELTSTGRLPRERIREAWALLDWLISPTQPRHEL